MKSNQQLASLVEYFQSLPKEIETIELKENNYHPHEIGKRISGLANAACLHEEKFAYLAFGFKDDSHEPIGTSYKISRMKKGNMELKLWLHQKIKPSIDFHVYEFDYNEKSLVILEIPPAWDRPITFDTTAYIRIGSSTTELKNHPEKERKIWNNLDRKNFEKNIAQESCTTQDVLNKLDYSKFFELTKQPIPSDTSLFIEQMAQHGLVKTTYSNNHDITNLGAILFANNLADFQSVKRKPVRVIQYKGTTSNERQKEYEAKNGYASDFENLINYINNQLPHNEVINKAFREEQKMYPEIAIRELVANALIHQDLTVTGTGPMIEIFDNRVEITNPGIPLIEVDRFIDHPPRSRNEDLASFMRQVKICEEAGNGIDRALIHIAMYQLPAPKFETYQNSTRVTLYAFKDLKNMSTDDKVRACYQMAVLLHLQDKKLTNESLRERFGIPKTNYPAASKIISEAMKRDLIKEADKSKEYEPSWA